MEEGFFAFFNWNGILGVAEPTRNAIDAVGVEQRVEQSQNGGVEK